MSRLPRVFNSNSKRVLQGFSPSLFFRPSIQQGILQSRQLHQHRTLFNEKNNNTMSYEDYYARMEALERDGKIGAGVVSTNATSTGNLTLVGKGETVPEALKKVVGEVYVTEGESKWEAVALKWKETGNKGLPDEEEFINLVGAGKEETVTIDGPEAYLTDEQYETTVAAVREATEGNDVRVYVLGAEGATRKKVFVIGREGNGDEARIVGVVAGAIES